MGRVTIKGHDMSRVATGSAADFLSFCMNHWDLSIQKQAGSIVRSTYMMGRRLTRLAEQRPDRVTDLGVSHGGVRQYEIKAPA